MSKLQMSYAVVICVDEKKRFSWNGTLVKITKTNKKELVLLICEDLAINGSVT